MSDVPSGSFAELERKLILCYVRRQLPGAEADEPPDLTTEDVRRLISTASVLALSDDAGERAIAYDLATRLVQLWQEPPSGLIAAVDLILSRLGNFPGRELLRSQYSIAQNHAPIIPGYLALERIARQLENTLRFAGIGDKTLTDFQVNLVDSLGRERSVSVSAPTSAGKSFVLALDVVAAFADKSVKVIVYVVPTRALIRQVVRDLLECLREAKLNEIAVCAAPTVLEEEQMEKGVAYVLTQERLLSLLYSPEDAVRIDRLYVDEAQELRDVERGMILHTAIREVVRRFPDARVCFASPMTANPGFLLHEFQIDANGEYFVEPLPPVSQTVLTLSAVSGKPELVDVRVLDQNELVDVQHVDIPFRFRGGSKERLARTAHHFTVHGDASIIYANGAAEAIDIALKLADLIEEEVEDPEVVDLVSFVRTHVHKRYALVDTLPKGVAFHYGMMPHLIRAQVEDLLKRKKIQFVVCTSTLLQGVNLAAKNIFLLRPRKGKLRPMESADFWNLAGRAGRLRDTFSGTIWCLEPDDWESKPLEGERLSEITSSFRSSLADADVQEALIAVIDDSELLPMVRQSVRVEQLFGKVFAEYTCNELEVANSPYAREEDKDRLATIDSKCRQVLDRLAVPRDVCQRNSGISPVNLDELWQRFAKTPRIEDMVPVNPNRSGALDSMRLIFRLIDDIFIRSGNQSWRYYVTLAYMWIRGRTLKTLIENHLSYNKVPAKRKETNEAIRKFLESLEQEVRFRYVKYLKAYVDTLSSFLSDRKRDDLKEAIAPLHLYIEFGASHRVLLTLMSLGLSRTTSILIRPVVTREEDIARSDCWNRLGALNLKVLDIPNVCKAEIRSLLGP